MSTWKPISTAPKDRWLDLWSAEDGFLPMCECTGALWFCPMRGMLGHVSDATHWREPDKGPGMEEGEVRWMIEDEGDLWSQTFECKRDAVKNQALIDDYLSDQSRVVRVRIVKEEEE